MPEVTHDDKEDKESRGDVVLQDLLERISDKLTDIVFIFPYIIS